MTGRELTLCWTEAANYSDADAYVSDLALSSVWGDDPEVEVPASRLDDLRQIYAAARASVRELRQAAGLTQAQLAQRFGIPKRTIENWEATGDNARTCPDYIRRMMAELLGQLPRVEDDADDR